MRFVVSIALLVLAGCPTSASEANGVDDGRGPPNGGIAQCSVDSDCVPAGSSCCECPTYALPATSGYDSACEDLNCPDPANCSDTVATCQSGSCVLACRAFPVSECPRECPGGYEQDASGCLTCACKGSGSNPTAECQIDSDCARAPADCCGCARGGADTAVPSVELDSFQNGLGCSGPSQCPEVDVCNSAQIPRCSGGMCVLAEPPGTGLAPDAGVTDPSPTPQFCGTDDYSDCPSGSVCVLNGASSEDANMAGVGVCQPE